ncbi:hypothetical protein SEA_LYELL_116 [Microbacterium phage Lyell]|nr:hypothetical protein SEA_LYELL_1 [Microbacterium phage Lyell]AXC36219.1 hypothetical protein SEA_LYELL_116 [Microbacterium phage Lyell]
MACSGGGGIMAEFIVGYSVGVAVALAIVLIVIRMRS